jgi:ribosome-associated heat shock protein Hsp15
MAENAIRLDQFLWYTRFAKSRAIAQSLVGEGHVRIDGRPARKAATPVRVGSVVGLPLGDQVRIVRVETLPSRRGPAPEARSCYTDLVPPGV